MAFNFASGTQGILASWELNAIPQAIQGVSGWAVQSAAVTFASGLIFNFAAAAAGDFTVNSVVGSAISGSTVTLSTQDPTNPRVDLIVTTSAGSVSALPGTPAALTATSGPVPPTPSASQLPIARIFVPASGTALSAASITDHRAPLAVTPAWVSISTQILSGTATSVSFAGLNTAYKVFRLTIHEQLDANASGILVRLNNDSGGNYDYQSLRVPTGAATGAGLANAATSFLITSSAATQAASEWAQFVVTISKQNATDKGLLFSQGTVKTAANTPEIQITSGNWRDTTNLISRIDVINNNGTSFAANSRFTLEGMKVTS